MNYFVYILRTSSNTLYIGQTSNLEERLWQHQTKASKSAKYLKYFPSFSLVYQEKFSARKEAMQREAQLKKWPKAKKEAIINKLDRPAQPYRMRTKKNWSGYVTKHSFALDLEDGVFTWDDPGRIARSLKQSAENSLRRKASPFQSAMSMLNFYLNRAGKKLPPERKRVLEQAKIELRKLF